jgi:hypothetical protein
MPTPAEQEKASTFKSLFVWITALALLFLLYIMSSDSSQGELKSASKMRLNEPKREEPKTVIEPGALEDPWLKSAHSNNKLLKALAIEGGQQISKGSECGKLITAGESSESTLANPKFYYMCEKDNATFNIWLTKKDIELGRTKTVKLLADPVPLTLALELCEDGLKDKLVHSNSGIAN